MSPSPLKILLTDPHLQGGGQVTYLKRLARQLHIMGQAVTIGCKPGSVLLERAQEAGVLADDRFTFRGGLRPKCWGHDIRAIRRYIQEMQPDILHVNGSQDHWIAGLGNWTLGRPVCVVRTRHNTYPVKASWPNRMLNRRLTDYQIVVCDIVRQNLAQHPAFDGSRMCSIHNGVDASSYQADTKLRAQMRAEFGYGEEEIVFGIAARLVKAKGHCYLFEAAASLIERFPQLRLLLLGQGALEPELRRQVAALGLEKQVCFAGFRTDMVACTQAFDIGILPSIDCDTSSFSLKEEMAAEKAVIASDHGGLPEIVNDGEEGFVVPAGTVAPLAQAMAQLIEKPALRRSMGLRARKRVLRDFSVEVFAQRTVEAYHEALALHAHKHNNRNAS